MELELDDEFELEFELEFDDELDEEFEFELLLEFEFEFELELLLEFELLLELEFELEFPRDFARSSSICLNISQNRPRLPSSAAAGWARTDVATKATVVAFMIDFIPMSFPCFTSQPRGLHGRNGRKGGPIPVIPPRRAETREPPPMAGVRETVRRTMRPVPPRPQRSLSSAARSSSAESAGPAPVAARKASRVSSEEAGA